MRIRKKVHVVNDKLFINEEPLSVHCIGVITRFSDLHTESEIAAFIKGGGKVSVGEDTVCTIKKPVFQLNK